MPSNHIDESEEVSSQLTEAGPPPIAVLLVPLKLFLVDAVCCGVGEVCVLCFSEDPPGTFPSGVFLFYFKDPPRPWSYLPPG